MVEQQISGLSHELERIVDADAGAAASSRFQESSRSSPQPSLRRLANGAAFRKGRELAAWLGLVPREYPPEESPSVARKNTIASF
jgi:transposase